MTKLLFFLGLLLLSATAFGQTVATPAISPAAGAYTSPQTVTISDGTSGATVFYTVDSSTPSCTHGATYSVAFSQSVPSTVKAIGCKSAFTPSAVASNAYTLVTTVGTPAISPAAGAYPTPQTITLSDTTAGATIFFTTDSSTPTCSHGSVYTGPFSQSLAATVKAIGCKTGLTTSSVASNAYTVASSGNTYYVDNCVIPGNDSNSGTSPSTPWLTINKVNTSAFSPGDSILLEDTCTWREQLSFPSSGSLRSPITVSQYGTGAQPVLNAASLLSSGWTNTSGNVWQAALTTAPNQVFFNTVRGVLETSTGTITAPSEWFWSTNVLYVYSTSNPSSAFTSPGIEASQRSYGAFVATKSYVNISGIKLVEAQAANIYVVSSTGNIASNLTSVNAYDQGIHFSGVTSGQITGNTVSSSGADGISFFRCPGLLIGQNSVTTGSQLPPSTGSDWQFSGGIHGFDGVGSTVTPSVVVQYNSVTSNGTDPTLLNVGRGIFLDTLGDGALVQYNLVANNTTEGILIDADNNSIVRYNVSYGNGLPGLMALADGNTTMTGHQLYNNTLYGNDYAVTYYAQLTLLGYAAGFAASCTNNLVENNIAVNTGSSNGEELDAAYGCENSSPDGSGNVYAYNAFGAAASNFIQWGATTNYSTYTAWETAVGNCGILGCSHSIQTAPVFQNTSAHQFWLKTGSPGIDAGLNIGTPFNIGLLSSSAWPAGVVTADQNSYGAGWEVGAFIYNATSGASFSPSSVSFGSQVVGIASGPQAITLTNTGSVTLNISGITLTGSNPGDFSKTTTCGSTLAASMSCTITVTFTPTATGSRSASVSVADDAPASPQTVALSGTGAALAAPTGLSIILIE